MFPRSWLVDQVGGLDEPRHVARHISRGGGALMRAIAQRGQAASDREQLCFQVRLVVVRLTYFHQKQKAMRAS